ncbi:uncharacterized protein [Aegilops tauschii subsp. strangulata]|uniref:Ubiquitin fusion degradation 1-like protein n=1 Tax=Aegilops tauschii subsp. strangulata TaxID=200361 RepID=A0A453DXQ2_AEGTS
MEAAAAGSSPMQWQAEEAWQAYLRQQRSRIGWAQYLRCRPMALLGKAGADDGNRVVMPASALDRINSVLVEYPLMFRVQNAATLEATNCGMLEFGAEEGFVYVPALTMARLGLEEDDLVLMTSTSLPKATSVKLRPHTMDFLGAKDLKRLLEFNVRLNTPCVTVGDTITVAEGGKRYLLDVVEAKPADAVSTLDTDCEVDFATPLDYVQPPAPVPLKVAAAPCQDCAHGSERRFVGVGMRMDGKPVETPPPAPAPAAGSSGKGKSASEHVLRFFGRRGSVAVPPPGAKSAKKMNGEEDKEAKWFTGQKYTL